MHGGRHNVRIGLRKGLRWRIVIARALVPQRTIDHDEIRQIADRFDLSGRSHANDHAAAACKQFLGDQNRERRADGAADDAGGFAGKRKFVEIGVIARPLVGGPCLAGTFEVADDIAIGIEDAERGNVGG